MKSIFVALLALFVSSQSFAQSAALVCSSGEPGQDNYLEISVDGNFVSFQQHETFFTTKMSGSLVGSFLYTYKQDVTLFSEGEEYPVQLTSVLSYSYVGNYLNVALGMGDEFLPINTKLGCQ